MEEYEVPVAEDGTSPLWTIFPSNQVGTRHCVLRYEVARIGSEVGIVSFLNDKEIVWIDENYLKDIRRAELVTVAEQEEIRRACDRRDDLEKIARFD